MEPLPGSQDDRVAPPVQQVVAALSASRKYADLCPHTLTRVAGWALARSPRPSEALKAAKRKLHQVYGSYLSHRPRMLERLIPELDPRNPDVLRSASRTILNGHASTAERLGFMADLYGAIFRITGKPRTVLDLACGFHPFALPWMDLDPGARYIALDIDVRLIRLINDYLHRLGYERNARCCDILVSPVSDAADVAFLLKSLPCLEQQAEGAASMLLASIRARHVVVSFPTLSLGGRRKGMYQNYRAAMAGIARTIGRGFREIEFPGEVFFVMDTAG